MRKLHVTIYNRKNPGYPGYTFEVEFDSVHELIDKVDELIEQVDFRKVDVVVNDENDQLEGWEIDELEMEDIETI